MHPLSNAGKLSIIVEAYEQGLFCTCKRIIIKNEYRSVIKHRLNCKALSKLKKFLQKDHPSPAAS